MRKNLKKQTAVLIVSAALAAQTSLAGYGAPLTPGDWKREDGAWRFCDPEQNAYAGWVLTSSGWYYMDPSDGKMVTGWKQINGSRYYFETQQGKTEGKMHTGWYQDEQGKWYFFNNKSGEKTEGTMVTGWKWIDGKCYYFSENEDAGVLYVNTVTPDGFSVNDQGQWVDENGNVKTRSESDFTTIQKSTTTVTRSSGSGGGSSHSSSSSSGNSGSSDNSGNSSNSGKDDTGKDDTGKDDTGKDDSGKDDSGKDDTGKDDSGKDDTGKDDSGKDDTGNGGDSGKDDSGNTDKPDDKPEETKILTGEAEVASNEYGSVSGTYQVKVKVTVDKDGNIISVEDDGTEPGKRNSSFWEDALELFEEFGGEEGAKTIEEVDQVEAVSGATISSNAIKAAVKKALQSEDPTEKPDAPAIKTADQRTRFVFSAAEPADLLITAPEGTQIRYTTDGSDPAGNSQAFVAEGTGAETAVSVSAAENATGTMILKAVAVKDGQASDVTEKELSFIQIPEVQEKGIKVYEASGMITSKTNKPYEGKIRITVVNGKIAKIVDNGTVPVALQDEVYWGYLFPSSSSFTGISTKFAGKDLSDLINAKTTPGGGDEYAADAVSRATISTDVMKYAAIQALQGEPVESSDEEVLAPKITSRYGFYSSPSSTIYMSIDKAENTTVRYTEDGTDPDVSSTKAETNSVSFYSNTPEFKEVRFAAFDEEGNRSKVVTVWCCFMKKGPAVLERGSYSAEVDGITASVDVNYSGYISSIQLDEASQEKYSEFLTELLAHVYYEQSADIEILSQYEEEGKKEVLSAVGAAIKKAISATPVFTVDPVKGTSSTRYGTYEYEEKPVATINCLAEGTEIYYYITDTSSTVKPDKDTWTKYEGPVSVLFDNEKGGSKYLWAATTTDDGETWLKTSKIQFVYSKKPVEDAVVIGDQAYTSFEKALAAAQDGDTLILNDDVELTDEVTMPEASISIQSGEKGPYLIKSTKPLNLNGDLTISDVSWNATTYANGYNFTAGENVTCSSTKDIYAGSASGTAQAKGEDNTCYITLSSGKFYVYGTGAAGSTMEGDVEVLAEKEAQLQFAGTKGKSELNGDFTVTVDATEGNAALSSSYGRTSSGTVSGEFTLTIKGAPKLSGTIYAVQYNSSASWGTLDVTEAELEELELDTLEKLNKKFQGFETVNSEFDEEDEKTEEEVAAELLSKVKEDEQENSQEKKETETVIPAEDPETEDKEEAEDKSENELEDKSNEDRSDAAEDVKEEENSDEEDKSAEEEDPEETEDADSKEDEEEDAPEVLDADETTEDTSSEEAETISQDEE